MINSFLESAITLHLNDDPLRALQSLDLLPAPYRENPTPEIIALRQKIKAALITSRGYGDHPADDNVCTPEMGINTFRVLLRAILIHEVVKALNAQGHEPHILEIGPGSYWLPVGLHALGFKFKYTGLGVNPATKMQFAGSIGDKREAHYKSGPKLFVAFEVIEHVERPDSLAWEAHQFFGDPDIALFSTPHLCYDPASEKVRTFAPQSQQHLRTYTTKELGDELSKILGSHFSQFLFKDQLLNVLALNRNSPYTKDLEGIFKQS